MKNYPYGEENGLLLCLGRLGLFDKAQVYFALYFSFFMVTIATELTLVAHAPFWATWFSVAMGELASLLVGAILIKKLAKVIDFVS